MRTAEADEVTTGVVVAVLTYHRPDDLGEVLPMLVEHLAEADTDASVLVIDNDVHPSAWHVVEAISEVRYAHEPRPGIAAARNRALDEAGAERLLIFLDDDERPEPGWLDALVNAWRSGHPAAVAGPVVSAFSEQPESWIEAGGYFRRRRHRTGAEVPVAATNNLLLDLDQVRSFGIRFDERFGISGGSDTYFTRQLVRSGGRIVWCDEAVVVDLVPPDRLTREWVLRRAERMGNSGSRAAVLSARPGVERWTTRARLVARGVVRVVGGGGRLLGGALLRDERHHARGYRTLSRGRGMVTGALGGVVVEYGRGEFEAPGAGE